MAKATHVTLVREQAGLFLLCLALFATLVPASGLASQDATLLDETILFQEIPSVFSASKYEQKVTEAPSSVSIVTADDIEKFGYRTLGDILQSIRGFYITSDRTYQYVGARGFNRPGDYSTRFLLMVDGHRLNDAIYGTAFVDRTFPVNVHAIDRVEVVRGPSSSLYGSSAFWGVINVITKRGRDLKGARVGGGVGSHDAWESRLGYGDRFSNGTEALVYASRHASDGERNLYFPAFDDPDLASNNHGVFANGDGEDNANLFASMSFQDFSLRGAMSKRQKDIPTAPWGVVFNDNRTRFTDQTGYVDLQWAHATTGGVDLLARLAFDKYDFNGLYVYDYAANDDPADLNFPQDQARGRDVSGELKATADLPRGHKLTLGGEYRNLYGEDQAYYDTMTSYLDSREREEIWALYLQDDWHLTRTMVFSGGLRLDRYQAFGETINPRLALIYNPLEQTTLKLLYGKAFRAPNAYERFYEDGVSLKANPGLGPEKIATWEVIVEQYVGSACRLSASGFHYQVDDLISQQLDEADDLLFFNNVEQVEATGFELEAQAKWQNGVEAQMSYTYQEARDKSTDSLLSNSPRSLAKTSCSVPLFTEAWRASLEVQYTGSRKNRDGALREEENDFWKTNLTLMSRGLAKGLQLSASVYNLFAACSADPVDDSHLQDAIPQEGRTFWLDAAFSF